MLRSQNSHLLLSGESNTSTPAGCKLAGAMQLHADLSLCAAIPYHRAPDVCSEMWWTRSSGHPWAPPYFSSTTQANPLSSPGDETVQATEMDFSSFHVLW